MEIFYEISRSVRLLLLHIMILFLHEKQGVLEHIFAWIFILVHKAASVCQFLTPENVTTLCHAPVFSRFISARLFSVPQV
jgi:hypothetical protein